MDNLDPQAEAFVSGPDAGTDHRREETRQRKPPAAESEGRRDLSEHERALGDGDREDEQDEPDPLDEQPVFLPLSGHEPVVPEPSHPGLPACVGRHEEHGRDVLASPGKPDETGEEPCQAARVRLDGQAAGQPDGRSTAVDVADDLGKLRPAFADHAWVERAHSRLRERSTDGYTTTPRARAVSPASGRYACQARARRSTPSAMTAGSWMNTSRK